MNINFKVPAGWTFPTIDEVVSSEKGSIRIGPFGSALKKAEFRDSGIRVLGIDHVHPNKLTWVKPKYIPLEKYEELTQYTVSAGDVLVTNMGTVGRTCFVPKTFPRAIISSHLIKVTPDQEKITSSYLSWALNFCPIVVAQIEAKCHGAIMAGFNSSLLKSLKIPLPPLDEQRRIAAILDKTDAVRRKRKDAIALTEDLLRSAFLEMFGDPVTNPKGWESGTILDIVSDKKKGVRCGPFGTQLKVHEIVSEGIPLYGIESVKGGRFRSKAEKHITIQKAEELKSFDVQSGDVLVTRMGTIGHACVVPSIVGESRFSYHLFRVRPDSSKCLPGFLSATITRSGTFLSQLERLSHGAIMSGLKTADLKEVRFLIPPMALQKQYLKIVSKSEEALERQIEKMSIEENLFNSLLQRAFRGDL